MLSSKRIISLVISCLFVVQILTSNLLNSSQVGAASSSEGYEILGYIENLQEEESKESTRIGDVDGNGEVNSIDFAFMRQYMLGIIKKFPAENKVTPTPSNSTVPTPTYVGPSKPTGLEYSLN